MNTKDKPFGVGIVGCGLIGQKRAKSLGRGGQLVACADLDNARAESLARTSNAKVCQDWRELVCSPLVDVVILATLHDSLAEITRIAAEAGKHVLVEKPAARSAAELEPVMVAATKHGVKVHVGFNHRYHRSLRKAKELVESDVLGELMFVRARYGHGARIGYDKEWRSNPVQSGGGELIDQGPHLIDLARWFLGEITEVQGFAHTYFWDMPVDEVQFYRCGNCEYFCDTPEAVKAVQAEIPESNGYCEKYEFACHSEKVCDSWEGEEQGEED